MPFMFTLCWYSETHFLSLSTRDQWRTSESNHMEARFDIAGVEESNWTSGWINGRQTRKKPWLHSIPISRLIGGWKKYQRWCKWWQNVLATFESTPHRSAFEKCSYGMRMIGRFNSIWNWIRLPRQNVRKHSHRKLQLFLEKDHAQTGWYGQWRQKLWLYLNLPVHGKKISAKGTSR